MKDKLGKFLMRWRTRVVLPHVRGWLLDIGCGTNHLVRSYNDEGIGVDVYQWGDVDLVVSDSAALPFQDQEFDTVAIVASLNHIPNRQDVLKEAHRLLRDDGVIIITMIPPRISRIWHLLREPWDADQRERGMKEGEVFGLTKSDLEFLLEGAAFRIHYETRFMLCINRLTIAHKALFKPDSDKSA